VIERKSGWKVKLTDGKLSWGYDLDKSGDETPAEAPDPNIAQLLATLASIGSATSSDWWRASGLPHTTFYRTLRKLSRSGRITQDNGRFHIIN
jgi:hypothetical protein